ncbi:MAG: class I SAM-dependent methyltransferase [Polyangiaceae bacterium]
MNDEELLKYNRRAWDHQVDLGDRWTVPVDTDVIAAARQGEWSVLLTPVQPVTRDWFPSSMDGVRVLGLASAGGQQCPVLAAAGAEVTSYDQSPKQLGQDAHVAEREGLSIRCIEGDMRDLSALDDDSFDLVFHPVSNCFVPDIRRVWLEAARVLAPGGVLLAGFINPLYFLFDDAALDRDEFVIRYRVPYDDREQLDSASLDSMTARDEPLCFGHTLEDQLAGQLEAGLVITDLYEDRWGGKPVDARIATFMATRALKR